MEATTDKLKYFTDFDLTQELIARGNLVDVWGTADIFYIDFNYRTDNNITTMDPLTEDDAKEILRIAQTEIDDNVGINWSILEAHYIDYIRTNNLI